jgi:hypothetical protein
MRIEYPKLVAIPVLTIKIFSMKTNATLNELEQALAVINKKYTGNISLFDAGRVSKNRTKFRLSAVSGLNGARISHSGKNIPFASWHVHGEFFEALFAIREDIIIYSLGKKITKDGGNWEDYNIGSMMSPLYASEVSIQQDDFDYFKEKLQEQLAKLNSKRTRNFNNVYQSLKQFAAAIERICQYTGQELAFEDITILTAINKGDVTKLKAIAA